MNKPPQHKPSARPRKNTRMSAAGSGRAQAARPRKANKKQEKKRAQGTRRTLLVGLVALVGTVGVAAAALLLGYGRHEGPGKGSAGAVEVDWPAGLGSEEAAAKLAELGLVDEGAEALSLFLRATGGTSGFVAGPHVLSRGWSPWEIRRALSRSSSRAMVKVTIPEGFNRFDIAARLDKLFVAGKKAFLSATTDATLLSELGIGGDGSSSVESAEGYLFPATYELPVDSDPREIVKRLVREGDKRWATIASARKDGLSSLQSTLGWGRREVLTMASIIEKEAAVDEERSLIASVFLNRLLDPTFRSKKLQSDPTSIYGCIAYPEEAPSCAEFNGKPLPAINKDPKNRYSTYTHAYLPPGPIANPGAKSIEAVLAPAPTKYYYFVAKGGGRHAFSESLGAHNSAVHKGKEK